MKTLDLAQQNQAFAGTGGVSANNRHHRFVPAFQDTATGHVAVSRYRDGRRAPMHLLEGLPRQWAKAVDSDGTIVELLDSVVAGFVRNGKFFTREEAAAAVAA